MQPAAVEAAAAAAEIATAAEAAATEAATATAAAADQAHDDFDSDNAATISKADLASKWDRKKVCVVLSPASSGE